VAPVLAKLPTALLAEVKRRHGSRPCESLVAHEFISNQASLCP
jgi:hypothetical protein